MPRGPRLDAAGGLHHVMARRIEQTRLFRTEHRPQEFFRRLAGQHEGTGALALPDSKATFRNAVVSGNTVVLEVIWRGTHTGPLQTPGGEMAPTSKKFELRACLVVGVAAGKAQSMRQHFDMATMMQQLGGGK